MNRWLEIVERQIECQMVGVVPSDCLFDQIVRRVIDEMVIDTIAQRAEIFQNAELNTANVAIFEELESRRCKGCGSAALELTCFICLVFFSMRVGRTYLLFEFRRVFSCSDEMIARTFTSSPRGIDQRERCLNYSLP